MASYNIVFQPSVQKDLRKLPKPMVARVLKKIKTLSDDPFPHQVEKLTDAEGLYRIRVGDYRVVYAVDGDKRQITIHYVRHRRDVYRAL